MFNSDDFIGKEQLVVCWIFAIILSPLSLIFWLINTVPFLIKNKKTYKKIDYLSILTPGFQVGLFVSILIFAPIYFVVAKVKYTLFRFKFFVSKDKEKHEEIVNYFKEIMEDVQEKIKDFGYLNTRISVVEDKMDRQTRIHLIENKRLNEFITIEWRKDGNIYFLNRYYKKNDDFSNIKSKLIDKIKNENI